VAALENQMGSQDLWSDPDSAAKVTAEHRRLKRQLDTYNQLALDVEDLEALEELAADDESMADELKTQREAVQARLTELEEARLFSGQYDAGNAVVAVHAGSGGTDSQDWAESLLRMEMRWAEKRGLRVELKELSPGDEAGIKSAIFFAYGENAYGLFSAEKGVHRLVRISPFDAAGRRHTSFALVDPAPLSEKITDVNIDEEDLDIDTYRSSGAGGQHVNKTDSAVRITHRPTQIVVQCQNERSQSSNKETALAMLRSRLLEVEEQKRREELAREKGQTQDVSWGSQIRSYVLHPYTMVKDHRTGHEVSDAERVMDGDLDGFVRAELLRRAGLSARDGSD
jgi:peptide chain release factor 2